MARSRVGIKGSNQRRIKQRDEDSDESDEEYKVTDEDLDESDECYSLDGDESEEISADFGKSKRVSRSRKTRRTSSGKKVNGINKPRKRRRVCYTEDDDDENDDEDDADFMPWNRETNQVNKPMEKKISYTEVDDGGGGDDDDEDDDGEEDDYKEFVFSVGNRKPRTKPREKKRVVYTEDEDGDGGGDDEQEEEVADEDDAEFMSWDREVNQVNKSTERKRDSFTEVDDDGGSDDDGGGDNDGDEEFVFSGRSRKQRKKPREKKRVVYTEDEEEEESDAEFKLSESDFVDDEDETPKMKKNKGLRSHPQKKNVPRGRKKSKKTKNPTKPKQRNHKSGPKLGSSKEKPITNKTKTENRSKISKKRKHRADWQRAMAESDSDFVSSASSDHEYTISEEEREQMREASIYCANLRAKLRSSSCGNQEKQPAYEQKKYPMRKGKEKVEDVKDDIGKQVCGICLSEEQKRTMRGVLNCCRHYFCFACIMEWSKVESRCPLCKQRFTTITKSAKSDTGFDLRTVVVAVPECDQVYEPSEEELRGYLDPYENVICTECQNGGDDALMLLCDICDSSAHTFCVGLGREVPEDNWYCEGCRPTVFGTLNSDRRLSNNASNLSSPSPIPGGFDLNELYVPETPLTQQTRVLPEPNPASSGTVATTLRERRRLHRQRHHQLLNSNRMNDLVGRSSGTSASSSGIRLFGSQLDQARVSVSQNDHIFPYSRTDQLSVQVQNSNLASADVALQDEHVALPEYKMGICTDPPVH
ncbi:putative chromatin regulator PHD family [Helianthus annuus]|nr:putative chromatin regulator PHD family [Helianthus annuus]KAJ0685380.1 putative chromatin regulator PHD family [Helianthus annuus]KAJ0870597.1 putative chromatin regulator PHD family [Helianthus annuus]